METSYLKLIDGTRIQNYLGLKMDDGYIAAKPQEAGRNYAYLEIPARELYNPSDESVVMKGMRNQYIRVIPACSVNVRGNYRFEVEPNPALAEFGALQGRYYLEPGDGQLVPHFHLWLRRDLELSDIKWAIRLYMRA